MTKLKSNEHLIKIDFNLPSHKDALEQAEQMIVEIRRDFTKLQTDRSITDKTHEDLYDRTALVLDWIGRMSVPAFDIRNELEEQYLKMYCKTPKLGRKLFDDHYSRLHHSYSRLKNRCFGLFEDLDNEYIRIFNEKPNNWDL